MVYAYKKQPVKVAILVGLLLVMAIAGSYMLYSRPKAVPSNTSSTQWHVYTMHSGNLRFSYPPQWSVSEADTVAPVTAVYVYSPDNRTTISIVDNVNPSEARITGTLLASEPAHLFGKTYVWNYIKAHIPDDVQTGSGGGEFITAGLMTAARVDAAWPVKPSAAHTNPSGISITIQNFTATNSADQLQRIHDVDTAKHIAESLAVTTRAQ